MSVLKKVLSVLGLIAVTLTLSACESTAYRNDTAVSGNGTIQSIELVKQDGGIAGTGYGAGTIAGGVIGGVLGSQVGSGDGNTIATIGGAAAGAYVGHQLEKKQQSSGDGYKFTIRMDNGSYQTLTQSTTGNFKVGDRVRIENGTLMRR